MAAVRRLIPTVCSGEIRALRASKWSSMLQSTDIGPDSICFSRDLVTMVLAVGSECGKCSVPIRAKAELELCRHISYIGRNIEIKIKDRVDPSKFR